MFGCGYDYEVSTFMFKVRPHVSCFTSCLYSVCINMRVHGVFLANSQQERGYVFFFPKKISNYAIKTT